MTQQAKTRCARCGVESPAAELFQTHRRSFRSAHLLLCPPCARRAKRQFWFVIAGLLAGSTVIVLAVAMGRPEDEAAHLRLIAAIMWDVWLALLGMTVVHELGHGLAGTLVGLRVFALEIGSGGVLKSFYVGRLALRICREPTGGICRLGTLGVSHLRLRWLAMAAAGPLVHALAIAAIAYCGLRRDWLAMHASFEDGMIVVYAGMWVGVFWWVLLGINCLMLVGNLVPRMNKRDNALIPSDGLAIWRCLTLRDMGAAKLAEQTYFYEVAQQLERGRVDEARRWCEEAVGRFPASPLIRFMWLSVALRRKRWEEAGAAARGMLPAKSAALRYVACNAIAWGEMMLGGAERLAEADRFSAEAYEIAPWEASVLGTRGSVLVELGRLEEGVKLLEESALLAVDRPTRGAAACWLARAAARRGDMAEARRRLVQAERLWPDGEGMAATRELVEGVGRG